MQIRCPRCKSKLEVDAIGDFVSCPQCTLEFNVEEPKKQKLNFSWSKINWFKLGVGGLAIFLGIIFVCGIGLAVVLNKSKNNIQLADFFASMGNGVGGVILFFIGLAFLCLLFVNIILWIFLPLMVYSIKQSLEEAVREIKNLNNI